MDTNLYCFLPKLCVKVFRNIRSSLSVAFVPRFFLFIFSSLGLCVLGMYTHSFTLSLTPPWISLKYIHSELGRQISLSLDIIFESFHSVYDSWNLDFHRYGESDGYPSQHGLIKDAQVRSFVKIWATLIVPLLLVNYILLSLLLFWNSRNWFAFAN